MSEPNYDEVICPNCVTQFRAIPVNIQDELKQLRVELKAQKRLTEDMRAVSLASSAANYRLEKELAALKQQEPVAWRVWVGDNEGLEYVYSEDGDGAPLYLSPGAQPHKESAL